MARFPFDIIGFDLDGTLFDTSADLADAVNHALALLGRPALDIHAVKSMIGRGTQAMLEQALAATGGCDPAECDRVYPALLRFYEANIARGTLPYPGLTEALDALAGEGVILAIVTNKPERLAGKLVDQLGFADRFACVIGGDTMGPGNAKPSAQPILEMIRRCGGGRAAFVGDSALDVEAARNAGIPSVAAGFGFLTQPVDALGADAAITGFESLLPVLRALAPTSPKETSAAD